MESSIWKEATFHIVDYVIMILFLLVSVVIGVYFGIIKKQRTTEEYLLGNRKMQLVPVALSLLVTFQSAISVTGTPSEVYVYDAMMYHVYIGISLSCVVQYFFIVPLLHPLKLTSAYEYLGRRFESRAAQLLGTCLGMFQTTIYMAVVLFAPSLALEAVVGIPLWLSVVVIGVTGTLYTSIGGIKSVIWTDVFQCVILFGGLTAILILAGMKVGRFERIIEIARDGGRLNFSSHSFDPRVRHTLWSLIIGGMFNWLPICCSQASVQRICSMQTEREAKIATLLNIPLMVIYGGLLILTGIVVYAYFSVLQCDPLEAGFIGNQNQIVPYFVMHVLSKVPGLAGVFAAALFSAALSSLSSGINSLAANTLQDILVNYIDGVSQVTKTLLAKIIVCVYGGITIGLAYCLKGLSGSVTQISLTSVGACGSPVVGMMCLGAVFPQANWIGALSGGIAGVVFNVWLAVSCVMYGTKTPKSPPITTTGCFINVTTINTTSVLGSNGSLMEQPQTTQLLRTSTDVLTTMTHTPGSDHSPLYDMSYLYFGLTGIVVSLVVGLIVSLLSGKDRGRPTEPMFIMPCLRKVWKSSTNSTYKEMTGLQTPLSDRSRPLTPLSSQKLMWYDKNQEHEL